MARGSLPWLILAAVLSTLFAILLESAFLAPTVDALTGTDVWATEYNQHTYEGKRMVGELAAHALTVISLGIWTGVLIDARRSA
jgi:hypothetical protein